MPEDEELEELREKKMEELEESGDSASREDQVKERREKIKQMASEYLTSEAQSRLGNIRAAKPELAAAVESQIASIGRSGRIDKIDDEKLKQILKEVQKSDEGTDIKFRR